MEYLKDFKGYYGQYVYILALFFAFFFILFVSLGISIIHSLFVAGICTVLEGLLFVYGISLIHLNNLIKWTPTSKIGFLTPGLVEIKGKAYYIKKITSPILNKKCAFYYLTVERLEPRGKHLEWVKIYDEDSSSFIVDDNTGKVEVQPFPDNMLLSKDYVKAFRAMTMSKVPNKCKEFMKKHTDLLSALKLRITEHIIDINQDIYVIGHCRGRDNDIPLIYPKYKNMFYVSEKKEDVTEKQVNNSGLVLIFFSLGMSLYVVLIAVKHSFLDSSSIPPVFLGTIAFYLLLMMGDNFITMYNGMVMLRNNIKKARGNIDTLIRERYDLIPNLAKIVKGYMKHEKEVMALITELRSSPVNNKTLLMITENYPKLKANDNFIEFQKTLERMEDRIAVLREFYNDSVKLYNSYIGKFPVLILARVLNWKPEEYIKLTSKR